MRPVPLPLRSNFSEAGNLGRTGFFPGHRRSTVTLSGGFIREKGGDGGAAAALAEGPRLTLNLAREADDGGLRLVVTGEAFGGGGGLEVAVLPLLRLHLGVGAPLGGVVALVDDGGAQVGPFEVADLDYDRIRREVRVGQCRRILGLATDSCVSAGEGAPHEFEVELRHLPTQTEKDRREKARRQQHGRQPERALKSSWKGVLVI